MILQRIASGLVFLTGLALLRAAVQFESWTLLVGGLAVACVGLGWLVLGGSAPAARPLDATAVARRS